MRFKDMTAFHDDRNRFVPSGETSPDGAEMAGIDTVACRYQCALHRGLWQREFGGNAVGCRLRRIRHRRLDGGALRVCRAPRDGGIERCRRCDAESDCQQELFSHVAIP